MDAGKKFDKDLQKAINAIENIIRDSTAYSMPFELYCQFTDILHFLKSVGLKRRTRLKNNPL